MLENTPTLVIGGVDTDENEPPKFWGQQFHYFNPILTADAKGGIGAGANCAGKSDVPFLFMTRVRLCFPKILHCHARTKL